MKFFSSGNIIICFVADDYTKMDYIQERIYSVIDNLLLGADNII